LKKVLSLILCFCLVISILPSTFVSAIEQRPSYLFAIDAGHGGNDPGCTGMDGRYECNDNYKIAQEVISLLEDQGQRTHLITRTLQTSDRPTEANNVGADFLISLHRDSSTSNSVNGINIYTHEPSHYQRIAQPTKDYAPNEHADKHAVDEKLVNNLYSYLQSTGLLSVSLPHYGSVSAPTWEDYFINRKSNMPSCIIEYGFATNSNDNAIFDNNYKTLALATVKALLATVGLSYVGPFESYSYPTIQYFDSQKYYVLNGTVQWDFSGKFEYNNNIYIIENGSVKNYTSLPEDGESGDTGQCKWIYYQNELKIIGIGDTEDYNETNEAPWKNDITTLVAFEGVTKLGTDAFKNCAQLTTVSLPLGLTEIKDGAFNGCTKLNTVYYYGTKSDFEKITIGNNNSSLTSAEINYICDINGHKYTAACSTACNVCGQTREAIPHTYSNDCDESCNICGEKRVTHHTYCSDCDTICDICGEKRTTSTSHSYNSSGICQYCGDKRQIPGDVNNDGVVDVIDAARIRKHILSIELIDLNTNPTADVNGDGVIDVIDAARIRKHILGIQLL